MLHGNEDIMGASSVHLARCFCQHKLGSSVRLKRPGSCVTYAMWLKIHLLIVLLSGQALGQLTSTAPSSIATSTTASQTSGEASVVPSSQAASSTFHTSTVTAVSDSQSSAASSIIPTSATTVQTSVVFYFLDVNVDVTGPSKNESDIIAWLDQVFRNELGHCMFQGATTTAPTSQQTVNVTEQVATTQTYKSTTAFYTSPQNFSATTNVPTVLQGNITSKAATMLNGNDTTTMEAIINSNITTTEAKATPVTENVTTPASITMLHDNTTTTVAATVLNDNKTTAASKASISNTTVRAQELQHLMAT
ncbi:cell wall protein DAN4-like isoform X2 [Xiphophorus hellerii]|uniref:cell wall protein DAN4-like isoform X2 n=1 Tax=Xiphophorus hellerii TaxID=8084 RepID=UPI0013B3E30E|nr:cell wall protein DAN4-like isoform X2 [Xiphophorus hellerii]